MSPAVAPRRRGRRLALWWATIAAALSTLSAPPAAAGDVPCAPSGPWVLAEVRALPRAVPRADLLDRLGVELSARGMTLCTAVPSAPTDPAAAHLVIDRAGHAAPMLRIDVEVRGDRRSKRASREVDLASAPRDRSATVAALAADELLRAASEELALERTAPDPMGGSATPTPPAGSGAPVRAASPATSADVPRTRRASVGPTVEDASVALGLRGGAEAWTGGFTLFGGDGLVVIRPWTRTRIEIAAGARAALEEDVADGTIAAHAFGARVGAARVLTRPGAAVELAGSARLGAHAVRITTPRRSGATTRSESTTVGALTVEVGPALRIPLGDATKALLIDVALAAAPIGAAAPRGDTGLAGLGVAASLGIVSGAL